ncbi:hypothetical protein GYM75_05235 [Gilliamella sp. ESL0441]|uniref:hypothetical protein n=1 Tax=Gilliamella sp. ESL0441 TaxID=2704654 RepID=UPI001C6A2A8D|nr:hypothetical protein [Gilliamella sp. ESL0441]QYN44292.1 hypothetical protein GYM75_05235 [Gilliamella sp. ESL0441]
MSIKAILFSIIYISIAGGVIWYLIFNKKHPLSVKKQEDNWIKENDFPHPDSMFSKYYMREEILPKSDIENPPSTTDILDH